LLFLGDLEPAWVQLEQGSALYDFQAHNTQAFQYGQDHGMTCLSFGSFVLWLLGYPDQALQRSREATALAQNLSHLNSQAFAVTISLWVFEFRRETNIVRERAEALIALATELGGALWDAWGTIFLGWALAEQGRREEGIAHLQRGLVALRETGAEMTRPHFLTLLAEMQGQVGQVEEGLAILTEALDITAMTSERWFEAETYRLKGELTLQSSVQGLESRVKNAEGYFLKAIEIARKQQAKSLELRAAMGLARLWRQQGKAAKGHQMLAAVYHWFTEGFDTADLQDAKALLDALS
jgi:adenylate cyclase